MAEAIASKTYQRGLGVGFANNAQNRALVELGAQRGWWAGWILSVADKPIAFWTGMTYLDCCYGYWTGYDSAYAEYDVGSLVFLKVVDSLCAAGVKRIDFGIGSALYKERFGDERKVETSFRIFAPTASGMARNVCFSGGIALERCSHAALQKIRLAGRLKRFLRGRAKAKVSSEATGLGSDQGASTET
jgi:CelD/BcsL family acetyltransferase involved in cellulose biosynthesis